MSEVYEAEEPDGTSVAVKIVRFADPDLTRRLTQEARALERVEHPGLVRLLDTGLSDGHAYLVMELVEGTTLAQELRKGPFSPMGTAKLGAQLAEALSYVHAHDIVHRDVKPSNILLTPDGRARLGDFGIARLLDASTFTATGTTLGTAAYMAPEQLEGHQVGPNADIWALGIVLLEGLTGRRVYEGSPAEVVARRLAGPVPLPPDLPVAWKLLLSGMLDHRPEQRLNGPEVAALIASSPFRSRWNPDRVSGDLDSKAPYDLTALISGPTPTAIFTPDHTRDAGLPASRPRRPSRTRRWVPAGLAAIALAALCIGLLLGLGSSQGARHPSSGSGIPRRSTTSPPPSTPSTTSTTTTIPLSSGPTALAALVADIASGEAAGTIDQAIGRSISSQAEQAVADAAAGMPDQAANALQQAAAALTDGVQSGDIAQTGVVILQADLSTLATALGLDTASVPPGTQPAGNGHKNGKANPDRNGP